MKLTDKKAINIYKRLKCAELVESIDDYPEDERDGRSDLQFLADEISYFRSCYEEYGHCFNEDLEEAKEFLRETKNGRIPCWNTIPPVPKYRPAEIEWKTDCSKRTIAEYKQLLYYEKKLRDLGYNGMW